MLLPSNLGSRHSGRVPVPVVLHIYHGEASSVGGASTSLFYLLRALDRQQFQSILLCHARGDGASRFDELDIPVSYHRMPRFMHLKGDHASLLSVRKFPHLAYSFVPDRWLGRFIDEHNVRLVHLHSAVQVSAALTCRRIGVPIVWHIRECIHEGMLGTRRKIFETMIRNWADAIICISEDEARPFLDLDKLHVIYNSVDFSLVDAVLHGDPQRVRTQLGIASESRVIGMVGAIASAKGIYDVVEAAARVVRQAHSTVRFLIVGPSRATERYERDSKARLLNALGLGDVDGRTGMETLIREKNLKEHFIFVGAQPDGLDFMTAMDIVLFPSHMDALGRPALEASALGKPVIATSRDNRTRIVKDGETGILIPPREPAQLANAILRLLDNPTEMVRLGQTGYIHARENFDSCRNAEQVMAVYDEVLAKRASKGIVKTA